MKKIGPWVDTRSSNDNTIHDSGRAVEKVHCISN